jgi:Spy/CpxP family protein refolding chaperone
MLRKGVITLLVGAVLALPAPMRAQGHHGDQDDDGSRPKMMGMMWTSSCMMGMGGMMGAFGPGPSLILKQKDALNLSDQQVERLKALQEEGRKTREAHVERIRSTRTELMEVMKSDKPDLSKYESALKKMADEHIKTQVTMARLSQNALKVLDAEQRSNVRYGMRLMGGMTGGMMGSGGCSMMDKGGDGGMMGTKGKDAK